MLYLCAMNEKVVRNYKPPANKESKYNFERLKPGDALVVELPKDRKKGFAQQLRNKYMCAARAWAKRNSVNAAFSSTIERDRLIIKREKSKRKKPSRSYLNDVEMH